MSVKAIVDVYNVEVDVGSTPMICKPVVAIWVPGHSSPYQDYLPEANYLATAVGVAAANAGIIAAAKAVCQAAPYNVEFGLLDTVQLARGIQGV